EDDDKSAPPAADAARKPGGSFEDAYKQIAPATVVVKTEAGFGTGVIVDSSGLILTNFHVVARGLQKDFRIKVEVNFGKPSGVGGMDIDEKSHEGWVVKTDRVRDLALIRVKDAPKDLKTANVAKGDPKPGQSIAAIGHAGIGMLWAMKTCHVAAIGEPAKNGILAAKDCSTQAGGDGLSEDDLKERRTRCESAKKEAQLAAAEMHGGLFVQSDCRIAPGDSGGPLVDDRAQIVGLNQSVTTDRSTAGGTSYHVHVAELREFIASPPADPVFHTPDPWCDGGTEATLEDLDMDGQADALIAKSNDYSYWSERRMSVLMDLDGKPLPDASTKSAMPYDAEAAYLTLPGGTFAWFDSNNDGRFDVLVADADDHGKRVRFDIDEAGKLTERKETSAPYFFDSAFIPQDEKMKANLGRWALAISPYQASPSLIAGARSLIDVPDPIAGIPAKGNLVDFDGNGKADAYRFQAMFASGMVLDVDGDSLGSLATKEDPASLVSSRKLDPEISVIVERGSTWVVYDRDNDKSADLAIVADTRSTDRIAKSAYTRASKTDSWQPAPEFVGMRSVRAGLLGVASAGELVKAALPFASRKEGLSNFPRALSKKGSYDFAKGPKAFFPNKAVLLGRKPGYTIQVFDADRSSKTGTDSANQLIQNKKLDAEVASVRDTAANLIWVYYDTDQDGAFDLVLFSTRPDSGLADKAFRIEGEKVRVDTELASGKLYRSSLLKDKAASAGFKKLAEEFLPANAVQD
ncbi:MAG: trypsin-like peptidase domain-containing protein, partial [Myxococcales bacterium]|nr:trypsin-like peptidase domain-containing protein [Myxococcales bacterium]